MSKHPSIIALREYQQWRRGGNEVMPDTRTLGLQIDWAIAVCEAAENLCRVKGRHHSEIAYKRLESAVNGVARP